MSRLTYLLVGLVLCGSLCLADEKIVENADEKKAEKKDEKKAEKKEEPSDPMKVGTRWKGTYFREMILNGKRETFSSDLELKITSRDGKKFKAESAIQKGKQQGEIEGTVEHGKVTWIITSQTKGSEQAPQNVIQNQIFKGELKGKDKKKLEGFMTRPKTDKSYRAIVKLELSEAAR